MGVAFFVSDVLSISPIGTVIRSCELLGECLYVSQHIKYRTFRLVLDSFNQVVVGSIPTRLTIS